MKFPFRYVLLAASMVLAMAVCACAINKERQAENLDESLLSAGLDDDTRTLIVEDFQARENDSPSEDIDWNSIIWAAPSPTPTPTTSSSLQRARTLTSTTRPIPRSTLLTLSSPDRKSSTRVLPTVSTTGSRSARVTQRVVASTVTLSW